MKKLLLIVVLCALTLIVNSQEYSVEKTIYGVQIGFLGFWIHNETKLSDKIALRSEVGFDGAVLNESFIDKLIFLQRPVFSLEPRWYYNLDKRGSKSKRIEGNSGNFLSLRTRYSYGRFVISNIDIAKMNSGISIIPTWGIRRNMGKYLTYETGIGVGYQYIIVPKESSFENESSLGINIHLRIGCKF